MCMSLKMTSYSSMLIVALLVVLCIGVEDDANPQETVALKYDECSLAGSYLADQIKKYSIQSGNSAQNRIHKTHFDGKAIPSISIEDYLKNIQSCMHKYKASSYGNGTHTVALFYMSRYLNRIGGVFTPLNVHRLAAASLCLAHKFYGNDEEQLSNKYFALPTGMTNKELNKLEVEMLFGLTFGLLIEETQYKTASQALQAGVM